jgi:hypothetical protein
MQGQTLQSGTLSVRYKGKTLRCADMDVQKPCEFFDAFFIRQKLKNPA